MIERFLLTQITLNQWCIAFLEPDKINIVGKKLLEAIKEAKKWPKSIPKITDKAVALQVGNALLHKNFFHRSNKEDTENKKSGDRILTVSPVQIFEEGGVYTWIYQGGMMFRYKMSG